VSLASLERTLWPFGPSGASKVLPSCPQRKKMLRSSREKTQGSVRRITPAFVCWIARPRGPLLFSPSAQANRVTAFCRTGLESVLTGLRHPFRLRSQIEKPRKEAERHLVVDAVGELHFAGRGDLHLGVGRSAHTRLTKRKQRSASSQAAQRARAELRGLPFRDR